MGRASLTVRFGPRRRYSTVSASTAAVTGSAAGVLAVCSRQTAYAAGRTLQRALLPCIASLAHIRGIEADQTVRSSTGGARGAGLRREAPVATVRAIAGTQPLGVRVARRFGIARGGSGGLGVVKTRVQATKVVRTKAAIAIIIVKRTPTIVPPVRNEDHHLHV